MCARKNRLALVLIPVLMLLGCELAPPPPPSGGDVLQDSTHRVTSTTGFAGPEAVRYDPDQDLFFVSNFDGPGMERDANGFISRLGPDGTLETLRFMTGTDQAPLHAPRGMTIHGDTLWVADIDGLHGFDRQTGRALAFVDFAEFETGFLNDLALGPDGTLYVTDTGAEQAAVYRVVGGVPAPFVQGLPGAPNGITWDAQRARLVLAPWGGYQTFLTIDPVSGAVDTLTTSEGGRFDGIEPYGEGLLVASQTDSTLYLLGDATSRPYIKVPGRPADIGLDTRRSHVAVPYIALNRVDVWALTEAEEPASP